MPVVLAMDVIVATVEWYVAGCLLRWMFHIFQPSGDPMGASVDCEARDDHQNSPEAKSWRCDARKRAPSALPEHARVIRRRSKCQFGVLFEVH